MRAKIYNIATVLMRRPISFLPEDFGSTGGRQWWGTIQYMDAHEFVCHFFTLVTTLIFIQRAYLCPYIPLPLCGRRSGPGLLVVGKIPAFQSGDDSVDPYIFGPFTTFCCADTWVSSLKREPFVLVVAS